MKRTDPMKFDRYKQAEVRSVVIIGDFMPSIFQPLWLASKNLIGENEAKSASGTVITHDICQFKSGDWLEFLCIPNKMQILTRKTPYFPMLRDFVIQLIRLIPNIRVSSIGLNYIFSLGLRDSTEFYEIGKQLSDLDRWKDILNKPTLRQISLQGDIDENDSRMTLNIQPTPPEMRISFGIDINVNNHFQLSNGTAENIEKIVERHYDNYAVQSKNAAIRLINEFTNHE